MWLCESANFPVGLWAYGYMLEELARRRVSFPGQSDYDDAIDIVKRLGTPKPPHALTTRWHLHSNNTTSKQSLKGVGSPGMMNPVKFIKMDSTQCSSVWPRFRHQLASMR